VQTTKGKNKFSLPWEGLFIVAELLKSGTHKLPNMKVKSTRTPRTLTCYDGSTREKEPYARA